MQATLHNLSVTRTYMYEHCISTGEPRFTGFLLVTLFRFLLALECRATRFWYKHYERYELVMHMCDEIMLPVRCSFPLTMSQVVCSFLLHRPASHCGRRLEWARSRASTGRVRLETKISGWCNVPQGKYRQVLLFTFFYQAFFFLHSVYRVVPYIIRPSPVQCGQGINYTS